jgi:protein-disulfide isomerase
LKISSLMLVGLATALGVVAAGAQTGTTGGAQGAPAAKAAAPLQLNSLDPSTRADPFPPVNQKFFTAASPTVDTVNSFLKAIWGYDSNRIWRVEAIQSTPAPGVSKVVVYVSDKSPNAKVQSMGFFITPDGKHAIADSSGVISFGATPFADNRKTLQARADGAWRGAASKDLLLVEFADMQCPHCKEAQATMEQLVKDFPNARVVFQSFPLTEIHPFAFKAAAYGYCVQKQKNDAFFPYAAAVFDTQTALTPDSGDQTLKDAVTKAGLDPVAVDACAATQAIKDQVTASIKLGEEVGVDQTPILAVNGRLLPLSQVPYEMLKTIVSYQAVMDGVASGASANSSVTPPTLGK